MKLYDVIRKEEHPEEKLTQENFVLTDPVHKKKRHLLFLVILSVILVVIYVVGVYNVRATITLEERSIPFVLDKSIVDLDHETTSSGERLSFQTMTVSSEINREIFGSQLKDVTGKSKGSIVIFNEYDKKPFTLKLGAKVVATSGKSYITQENITVPGYTLDGKKRKPGTSNAVNVIAVESGPDSNSEGDSLVISNFTGLKRKQIYARTIGAFKGGESGMRHTVSEGERPQIIETLKTQLSERLRRETRAQIPEQLVTYPDLQFIYIDTDSLKLEGDGVKFSAQIKGSMVSYLIPRNAFETSLAKEVLSNNLYKKVSIPVIDSLSVVPQKGIPADSSVVSESISVLVSGQGSVITKIDPELIKTSLVGTKRSTFNESLSSVPEISSAKFNLIPFWSPFFPAKEKNIEVIIR
jgi:hypothetical protein